MTHAPPAVRPINLPRRQLAAWPFMAVGLSLPGLALPVAADTPLRAGGAGAGVSVLQRVATDLHAPLQVVPSLGSAGGIRALAARLLDLAISGRRLKDDERQLGLVDRELFVTGLVWAVHPGVPVQGLSLGELADRYANVSRWPDGQPVRLVLRPEGDSDTRAMQSVSTELAAALARAAARPGMKVAQTDDEAIEALERIPGSLGVTSLSQLLGGKRSLRTLAIDGVTPDLATLTNGRYRYRKSFYLVTRADMAPVAGAAIAALTGRRAAEIYARQGCVVSAGA